MARKDFFEQSTNSSLMYMYLKQYVFHSSIMEGLARNVLVSAGSQPGSNLRSACPGRLLSFFLRYLRLGLCPASMERTRDACNPFLIWGSLTVTSSLAAHTPGFDFPGSESYSRTVSEGVKNNQAGTCDLILFRRLYGERVGQRVRASWLLVQIHSLQFWYLNFVCLVTAS